MPSHGPDTLPDRLKEKTQMKTKPTQEVRLGSIKAAIWKNETETGIRYNVTFRRLYREEDRWKVSDSFGRDDLLLLRKVADQAHSWILARNQEQQAASRPGEVQARCPNDAPLKMDAASKMKGRP